jgi:hypothetical protein
VALRARTVRGQLAWGIRSGCLGLFG